MKNRLGAWILVLVITLTWYFGNMFLSRPKVTKPTYYFEVVSDSNQDIIKQSLNNKIINKITYKQISNLNQNPQIIIADNNYNSEDLNKFTKYKDFYYSPIVLFAPNRIADGNMGFSIVNLESSSTERRATKDLRIILNAMLENKTWQEINVSSFIASETISLVLPDNSNPYYENVKAMIYYALNDYNELTENDVIRLNDKVNIILSKCEFVENIANNIYNTTQRMNFNSKIFLAPEFIISESKNSFKSRNNYHYQPVYFPKTLKISHDLYILNDENIIPAEEKQRIIEGLSHGWTINSFGFRCDEPQYSLSTYTGFEKTIESITTTLPNMKEFVSFEPNPYNISKPKPIVTEEVVVEEISENIEQEEINSQSNETSELETKEEAETTILRVILMILGIVILIILVFGLIACIFG